MFTKDQLVDKVFIEMTFDKLYKDEGGKPIIFKLEFKMETGEIAERLEQFGMVTGRTTTERNLERFCILLDSAPVGFGDFKVNGDSLYKSAKEYFGDTRMEPFVTNALTLYNRAVSPQELFRRV